MNYNIYFKGNRFKIKKYIFLKWTFYLSLFDIMFFSFINNKIKLFKNMIFTV